MAAVATSGVVGCCGVALCRLWREIFKVGHVNLNEPVQSAQHLDAVVAGAVPHNWDSELRPLESRDYLGHIVGAGDKVYVVYTLVLKLKENVAQPLNRNGFADFTTAYLVVLAEHAAQVAAGKNTVPEPRSPLMHGSSP